MEKLLVTAFCGMLTGLILALTYYWIDELKIKKEIREERSKMFKMQHPKNGFCYVAKTEKELIKSMIENYEWKIINEEK